MPSKRITDFTTPTGGVSINDIVPIVDVSDTTDNAAGSSRKTTVRDLISSLPVTSVTASRNAVLTDSGTLLVGDSTSSVVLTLVNDSTVAWTPGSTISLLQKNTGAVSFAAGSGVTLLGTVYSPVQYGMISAVRIDTNTWVYL